MKDSLRIEGVDGGTEIRVAARLILTAKAEPLFALEERAAGGRDEKAVHDMRVASRRVREALRLFAPFYRHKTIDAWCDLIRRVTRTLGTVRDADVFIETVGSLVTEPSTAEERAALAYLLGYRQAERAGQLERMRRRLRDLGLASARGRFVKAVARGRDDAAARRPLRDLAQEAVTERLDAMYALVPAALVESDAEPQHALRIACKRVRYALETLAPCFDDSFDRLHKVLVRFQDALGEVHDRDVFIAAIGDVRASGGAWVAGVTEEGLDRVADGLADQRHEAFLRFRRLAAAYPEAAFRAELLAAIVPAADALPADAVSS